MEKTIHEILTDFSLSFTQKLQIAAASELVFWEDRLNPPNLTAQEFMRVMFLIPITIQPSWAARKSAQGKYGKTGEKQIFKFEFLITLIGRRRKYFVKGFFFEDGDLHGVEIQSFREEPVFKPKVMS
jgi:hypothetical protein